MAPEPIYPLYASTYNLHRLSPLYNFHPTSLPRHASTLHNLLRGEVLRGVRVGLGSSITDDTLARIGSLQFITWKTLSSKEKWEEEQERLRRIEAGEIEEDDTVMTSEDEGNGELGNIVEIEYEKARYTAILLRDQRNEGEGDEDELGAGFASFPLLFTRMPGPLREMFIAFLATTFDTRPSVMKLSPKFLTGSLESYLADLTSTIVVVGGGEGRVDGIRGNRVLRDVVKDLVVTRTFAIAGDAVGTLKSLDVTISREDLWPLLVRGRKLLEVREEGGDGGVRNPFSMALAHHIDGQLALNLDHKSVGMSRIACGAFILGGEGKIKIAQLGKGREGEDVDVQERATKALLNGLIEFAKTRALY